MKNIKCPVLLVGSEQILFYEHYIKTKADTTAREIMNGMLELTNCQHPVAILGFTGSLLENCPAGHTSPRDPEEWLVHSLKNLGIMT